jgi:site-specific DNA-cytosine methylase
MKDLKDSGYKYIKYKILNASDYGVPQLRQRFVLLASKKIDVGVQSSMLFANSSRDISIGAYFGYNIFDTAWFIIGYNHSGFNENDFNLQTYHSDGVYAKLRMRFDQKSLGEMAKALAW